jgi:16S rRNA U516 pseudouridylate synthase RsuA-like enzyme
MVKNLKESGAGLMLNKPKELPAPTDRARPDLNIVDYVNHKVRDFSTGRLISFDILTNDGDIVNKILCRQRGT